jgi:hypothetical protein
MSVELSNDKRHFHRIFYNSEATLSSQVSTYPCRVVDISLKGCLLRFNTPWIEPIEDIFTLKLQLSEDLTITMQVTVTHVIGNDAGFKCEHIDIDSISQLRRLVELNLGDSDLLERDLLALTDLKA